MKHINSIILYILFSVLPVAAIFILFEGHIFQGVLALYILTSVLLYTYLDKIVLILLSSREVIDTDEQKLFQCLKNESYKSFQKVPRVYVYSGDRDGCFILESRKEWTVVLSRKLVERLEVESLECFVKYLFDHKKKISMSFRTRVVSLLSMQIKAIHFTVEKIVKLVQLIIVLITGNFLYSFLNKYLSSETPDDLIYNLIKYINFGPIQTYMERDVITTLLVMPIFIYALYRFLFKDDRVSKSSNTFKILSVFSLVMMRPLLVPFEKLAKKKYMIAIDTKLSPIVDDVSTTRYNFNDLLVDHFGELPSTKKQIKNYIEGFSILRSTGFVKNEIY